LPLDWHIDRTGWRDRLLTSRLAPWQKAGVTFGIPHDVHPCTITYRDDLFREAGVDLAQAKTWKQFHEACLTFTRYWRGKGLRTRHAIELPESSTDYVQTMLLQRGINPIDSYNNIFIDDPKVAQTIALYATMVAGSRKISAQTPVGIAARTKDITDGSICAFFTPDWDYTYVKQFGASVSGKFRMMPLPVFDPTDTPTSTRGGTMLGITRACKNSELAWKLLEYLYFSEEGIRARQKDSDILPPVKAFWSDSFYNRPDPFLADGQSSGKMFVELAGQIPKRYVTPLSNRATRAHTAVRVKAVESVREHDGDNAGLEQACQKWLKDAAEQLKARMIQQEFDE
jgi:ABC-type glycerol-3-phosphate transport system substrate-binding protein